jgi:hypothetical protein
MSDDIRRVVLSIYPADERSPYSAGVAEVYTLGEPDDVVAQAVALLLHDGWVVAEVLRNDLTDLTAWEAQSPERAWVQAALTGAPQVHIRPFL